MNNDELFYCIYCGDTMEPPSPELLERFGTEALNCCGYKMAKLDRSNLYKLLKGLDKLKTAIEHEITKDF